MDADEVLSPELAKEVHDIFERNDLDLDGFRLPFLNNYCGKWIKHGRWFPEDHFRLFDKSKVFWNQDAVHEGLERFDDKPIKSKKLNGYVHHYTMSNLSEHIQKMDRYSTLAAQKMFLKGKEREFCQGIF